MAMTVTATMGGAGLEHIYLWVRVYTGATETGGASDAGYSSAGGNVATGTLTPNFSNSAVQFGLAVDDWGGVFTAAPNNTIDSSSDDPDDWGAGFGRYTGTVTAGTPLTYGASAVGGGQDGFGRACYEIPATGGTTPAVDGSSPVLASATGSGVKTVTSASFTPPAGSVVAASVLGGGSGSSGTITFTIGNTGSLTFTQRAATGVIDDQGGAVFTATVPGGGGPVGPTGAVAPLALAAPAGAVNVSGGPAGAVAPLTLAAPAGSVKVSGSPSGAVAPIALAAPAGSVRVSASPAGAVAPVALAAPPGSVRVTAAVPGALAGLVLAAPPGSVSVTSGGGATGVPAVLTFAAPPGSVHVSASVQGVTAALVLTAPGGTAAAAKKSPPSAFFLFFP